MAKQTDHPAGIHQVLPIVDRASAGTGYGTGDSDAYEVLDITLNDPKNRPLKAITIGAGISGIMMAYKIQEMCINVEHIIYEKNDSIGGTWFENRYPGVACDIPAHGYTYPWAPNSEWPKFLSTAEDVMAYLNRVVDTVGLRKYVKLSSHVAECLWDEDRGKWKVRIQQVEPKSDMSDTGPYKVLSEYWDEADILFHATGLFSRWDLPTIPGLDKFRGRVIHTAGWPNGYEKEQWKDENVVVIGSGASSVQTVPSMQPYVKQMTVFVRTPVWFVQIMDNFGNNHEYSEKQREEFRKNPEKLFAHVKGIEDHFNATYDYNILNTSEQLGAVQEVSARMKEHIKDSRLLQGVVAATEDGVTGADGVHVKCDTIICATGFDMTYRPRFSVIGKNGVDLREKWKDAPKAYFGMQCPDMPNWITFFGPNWPVAAGSVHGSIDAAGDYAVKCIQKMQSDLIKSFVPKQHCADEFNEHTQAWAKKMIWSAGCRSGYKDNETGTLRVVYAGSTMHFRTLIQDPRWEDMDIQYLDASIKRNRYAFMGIGRHYVQTKEARQLGIDPSPYYNMGRIDKRFLPKIEIVQKTNNGDLVDKNLQST
ncbi:hypothetical protein A0O28_0028220 [Trichoderma guizhouense]|uniref:Flavin-binding monooxygenase n=1 Tax=Trichoderma guizhouense TaxID=1491466 RepID=A0A1T3CTW4_9HYPO|nr:hypothetical protein A0O28_0028220 [Trichoderma guizhouense]